MSFSLLANICAISMLDFELFFNYSGYPPSLGVVTVGNRPVLLLRRTFVRIGMFPLLPLCAHHFPSLLPTKSGYRSHHPASSIIPPFDDEQAVSTATGPFPFIFFANCIV